MLGPEGAAQLTTDWLRHRLPLQLVELRQRYDVPADVLPDPGTVEPVDRIRLALEHYPAVLVEVLRLRNLTRVDVLDAGVELYAGRYAVRVYTWVRGHDEASTDLVRKRYLLAVRESLLARRQLAEHDAPLSGIAVDPTTLAEQLSPTMVDQASATILGSYLDVDVTIREELATTAALGLAGVVEPDTAPVPHPATL